MVNAPESRDLLAAAFSERGGRDRQLLSVALERYRDEVELQEESRRNRGLPPGLPRWRPRKAFSSKGADYYGLAVPLERAGYLRQVLQALSSPENPVAFAGWSGDNRPDMGLLRLPDLDGTSGAEEEPEGLVDKALFRFATAQGGIEGELSKEALRRPPPFDQVQTVAIASHGLPHTADTVEIHLVDATRPHKDEWAPADPASAVSRLYLVSSTETHSPVYLDDLGEYFSDMWQRRGLEYAQQSIAVVPDRKNRDHDFPVLGNYIKGELKRRGFDVTLDTRRLGRRETRRWAGNEQTRGVGRPGAGGRRASRSGPKQ